MIKIGEIAGVPISDSAASFWRITGMCCDDENNLYIADSGHNKIFKFNKEGKPLSPFGRVGQGPGEFLGSAHGGNNLRLSISNTKEIFIMDPGNERLSTFSKDGRFLRQYGVRGFLPDSAMVDSKGSIYLLSRSGIRLIDCYDKNLRYLSSFLDVESHLLFPFGQPALSRLDLRLPSDYEVIKAITADDKLIVLSNYALRIFVIDTCNNNHVAVYEIDDPWLRNDLEKRLSKMNSALPKKEMSSRSNSQIKVSATSILPFRCFIYQGNKLFVCYRNSDSQYEVYEYGYDRGILSSYRFPEPLDGTLFCSDKYGRIYASMEEGTKVGIFVINKLNEGVSHEE